MEGNCIHTENFDEARYQEELTDCDAAYEFCLENDGVVRNMTCCGPLFILFPLLMLALCAGDTS